MVANRQSVLIGPTTMKSCPNSRSAHPSVYYMRCNAFVLINYPHTAFLTRRMVDDNLLKAAYTNTCANPARVREQGSEI